MENAKCTNLPEETMQKITCMIMNKTAKTPQVGIEEHTEGEKNTRKREGLNCIVLFSFWISF